MAEITQYQIPTTIEEKKQLLLENRIALWDVLTSCEITGSSDISIKKEIPSDLSLIFCRAKIKLVILNGSTAFKFYKKYNSRFFDIPFILLPSTSPANASYSYDQLKEKWGKILKIHFSDSVL